MPPDGGQWGRRVVYVLAASFPPVALPWCRKPWQALLNAVLVVGLIAGDVSERLPDPLPALGAVVVVLWAVGAVAQRRALGRAARRIRETWAPPAGGP
jgi:hypothetical protein